MYPYFALLTLRRRNNGSAYVRRIYRQVRRFIKYRRTPDKSERLEAAYKEASYVLCRPGYNTSFGVKL